MLKYVARVWCNELSECSGSSRCSCGAAPPQVEKNERPATHPPRAFSQVETRPRIGGHCMRIFAQQFLAVSPECLTWDQNSQWGEMMTKYPFILFIVSLGLLRVKVSSLFFPFLPIRHPLHPSTNLNRSGETYWQIWTNEKWPNFKYSLFFLQGETLWYVRLWRWRCWKHPSGRSSSKKVWKHPSESFSSKKLFPCV